MKQRWAPTTEQRYILENYNSDQDASYREDYLPFLAVTCTWAQVCRLAEFFGAMSVRLL